MEQYEQDYWFRILDRYAQRWIGLTRRLENPVLEIDPFLRNEYGTIWRWFHAPSRAFGSFSWICAMLNIAADQTLERLKGHMAMACCPCCRLDRDALAATPSSPTRNKRRFPWCVHENPHPWPDHLGMWIVWTIPASCAEIESTTEPGHSKELALNPRSPRECFPCSQSERQNWDLAMRIHQEHHLVPLFVSGKRPPDKIDEDGFGTREIPALSSAITEVRLITQPEPASPFDGEGRIHGRLHWVDQSALNRLDLSTYERHTSCRTRCKVAGMDLMAWVYIPCSALEAT
ncbi:MAG: hypothetical protein HQL97_05150 [Magnetococcales bacterium]|nr:hypothetical protein [Magnetococcales bacterium]